MGDGYSYLEIVVFAVIAFRPRLLGERAAQMLLGMLDGAPPTQELLPTFFDPRASCSAPAASRRVPT